MRRFLGIALVTLLAVACGGEGEPEDTGDERAVVRSADGRAELRLPAGRSPEGIEITSIDDEEGAVGYELQPSGTTFDPPATMTIKRVASPERGALAFAVLVSDDGVPELVDTSIAYPVGDGLPTVSFEVAHFSSAWVNIAAGRRPDSGADVTTGGTIELHAPFSAAVGEPFEATAEIDHLLSGYFLDPEKVSSLRLEVTEFRGSGSLAATNATPAAIADVPAKQVLKWAPSRMYEGPRQFTCQRPRRATLTYSIELDVDYRFVDYRKGEGEREVGRGSATARGVVQERVSCTAAGSATTSSTSVSDPAMKPIVKSITVILERPKTTYGVSAVDPTGGRLEAYWKLSGEACGTPKLPFETRAPWVTWSHADAAPDSCAHTGTDHDITISVTVAGEGGEVTCVIQGSESKTIDNPRCI